MSERKEAYEASILDLSKKIKISLDILISFISDSKSAECAKISTSTVQAIDNLNSILVGQDRPVWVNGLRTDLVQHKSKKITDLKLLNNLHLIKPIADQYIWFFENDDFECFDFDKMFERYRDEGNLPELFDEIIDILTQILHSGDVESRFVIDALQKVIGTLKQSKSGSLFSMNAAWQFFCDFAKNYLLVQISSVTGLEALVKTLEDTMERTTKEVDALTQNTFHSVRQETGDLKVYAKDKKKPVILINQVYGNDGAVTLEGESSRFKAEA